MVIYAKIYAKDSKKLVLECSSIRNKGCYPSGEWTDAHGGRHFSIGCTVVGAEHIAISPEAKNMIKFIDAKAIHSTSDLGDISLYQSMQDDVVFSWVGHNTRVINLTRLQEFEIGEGETKFDLSLLDKINTVSNEEVQNIELGKTYIKGIEY